MKTPFFKADLSGTAGISLIVSLLFCAAASAETRDARPPSRQPPGGLTPAQCPQFIVLGCDDNQAADGIDWVIDAFKGLANPRGSGLAATFDGSPAHLSFYAAAGSMDDSTKAVGAEVIAALRRAYQSGHEVGNHTWAHRHGGKFTLENWTSEIAKCNRFLAETGIPEKQILGFRAPFLEFNPNVFTAIEKAGMVYDCSIQGGLQNSLGIDGTNCFWPYTLDWDRPEDDGYFGPAGKHPGVWELPVDALHFPRDFGSFPADVGINDTIATAFDWNLWVPGGGLAKEQFVRLLKHNLDLKYRGNRCPMHFGFHSEYYSPAWAEKHPEAKSIRTPVAERRAALKEFLAYALTLPDVRVVSAKELVGWLRHPTPLGRAGKP